MTSAMAKTPCTKPLPPVSPDPSFPYDGKSIDVRSSFSGKRRQRYYMRAVTGIIAPLSMAIYYCAIWRMYLTRPMAAGGLAFGLPGGSVIYYSWLFIAAVGLNISQYALEGIEASILMDPRWGFSTAVHVLAHSNRSWARPDGWNRVLSRLILGHKTWSLTLPPRLWLL